MKKWQIDLLAIDNYVGNRNERVSKERPELSDILAGVEELNGGNVSSMAIVASDGSVLAIGGGPKQFHMGLTRKDQTFALLSPQPVEDSETILIIGGVTTTLPSKYVVPKEYLVKELSHFYYTGLQPLPSSWEEC
jgi:hypothetical protein